MSQITSEIEKCFANLVNNNELKDVNERKEEFKKFKNIGIPNNKSENWKYSSLVNDINEFSDLKITNKRQKINFKKKFIRS